MHVGDKAIQALKRNCCRLLIYTNDLLCPRDIVNNVESFDIVFPAFSAEIPNHSANYYSYMIIKIRLHVYAKSANLIMEEATNS